MEPASGRYDGSYIEYGTAPEVKEQLPCYLSHLTALTRLDIDAWLLPSTTFPPSLQQLVSGRLVWPRELALLTATPGLIQRLSLKVIPAAYTQLTALNTMSALTALDLCVYFHDALSDLAPILPSLSSLRALTLSDDSDEFDSCPITPAVLSHLAATTSLTRLRFDWDVDAVVRPEAAVKGWCEHVAQLQQLRHLYFGGDYAFGSTARHLARLTQLTYLGLSCCHIPDLVAVAIGCSLKGLVHLDLFGNQDLSDACAPAIAQLTKLTELRLAYLPGFTEEGLRELSTLKKLQQLDVDKADLAEGAVEALWAAIRR